MTLVSGAIITFELSPSVSEVAGGIESIGTSLCGDMPTISLDGDLSPLSPLLNCLNFFLDPSSTSSRDLFLVGM